MKKSLMWLPVLLLVVSMLVSFSLAGCKEEAAEEEAPAKEEAVAEEGAPAEEEAAEEEVADKEPINIGVIGELTGTNAQSGQEMLNGAILMAEERGNILGHPINVVAGDAADEPAAISETTRLATTQNVLAVFGSTNMSNAMAIPRVLQDYGIPMLEIDSWDDYLTEQGWENYFQVCQKSSVYAKGVIDRVVDYFAPMLGKEPEELRIAFIYDDWAENIVGVGIDYLKDEYGVEPVYVSNNPWDTPDYTSVIEEMKAKEPIDIFIPEQITQGAVIVRKQMISLEYKPAVLFAMGVGWEFFEFRDQIGAENAEGVFTWSWPASEMNYEPAKEFGEKYLERFGIESGTYGIISYSTMGVLLDEIEKILEENGEVTPALVSEALQKVDIDYGVLPMYWGMKFDPDGTNTKVGDCNILQWQNGKRVVVWPEEVASGEPKLNLK